MSLSQNTAKHRAPEVPIIVTEIDWDAEEELSVGRYKHAISVCVEHAGPAWHPVHGTITEGICGTLFRWDSNSDAELCEPCTVSMHGTFNCYVCGREIYG